MLVGRYAPSPTGNMHLGNARTALLAWLHSRAAGGRHILRFEDLDTGRVRSFSYDSIRRDLEWLGLDWDAEYQQSQRLEIYQQALEQLPHYPCYCSRKEILAAVQDSAGAPHDNEAVYSGKCRPSNSTTPDPAIQLKQLKQLEQSTRPVALRWLIPDRQVCVWDEFIAEQLCQELSSHVGDMVLRRKDNVYAYHLAVVVDDAAMQISDVLRAADLWPATPRQVALQQALGYPTPRYWHVPLMHDYHGQRLAKRNGAPAVTELRQAGARASAVLGELLHSLPFVGVADLPTELTATEALDWWKLIIEAS